jgi:hypothetical protein
VTWIGSPCGRPEVDPRERQEAPKTILKGTEFQEIKKALKLHKLEKKVETFVLSRPFFVPHPGTLCP